jgi:hypothetical protein
MILKNIFAKKCGEKIEDFDSNYCFLGSKKLHNIGLRKTLLRFFKTASNLVTKMPSIFLEKKSQCYHFRPHFRVFNRVARFFLVHDTKTGNDVPSEHKI